MADGWTKKFKGSAVRGGAWIYTHPALTRAIVQNHNGVSYDGQHFASVEDAKAFALKGQANG